MHGCPEAKRVDISSVVILTDQVIDRDEHKQTYAPFDGDGWAVAFKDQRLQLPEEDCKRHELPMTKCRVPRNLGLTRKQKEQHNFLQEARIKSLGLLDDRAG